MLMLCADTCSFCWWRSHRCSPGFHVCRWNWVSVKFQPDVIANKDVIFFLIQVHRDQVKNLCTGRLFALSPSLSRNMDVPPFSFFKCLYRWQGWRGSKNSAAEGTQSFTVWGHMGRGHVGLPPDTSCDDSQLWWVTVPSCTTCLGRRGKWNIV